MIKNKSISLNEIVSQRKGHIVSDMNGEKVLLSVSNSKYYNLGEIGGKIWESIAAPTSVIQLVSNLVEEYEVERSECEEHVLFFLDHLLEEELIEVYPV